MCLARGSVTVAVVADHVTPHRGNWTLFLTGELQSLCENCHNGDKHRIDMGTPPLFFVALTPVLGPLLRALLLGHLQQSSEEQCTTEDDGPLSGGKAEIKTAR